MTAGLSQSSSRLLAGLIELLVRKGVVDQGEIEALLSEPGFSAETTRQYEAFYKSIKK